MPQNATLEISIKDIEEFETLLDALKRVEEHGSIQRWSPEYAMLKEALAEIGVTIRD